MFDLPFASGTGHRRPAPQRPRRGPTSGSGPLPAGLNRLTLEADKPEPEKAAPLARDDPAAVAAGRPAVPGGTDPGAAADWRMGQAKN